MKLNLPTSSAIFDSWNRWSSVAKTRFYYVSRDKILHDPWSISRGSNGVCQGLLRPQPPSWKWSRPWERGWAGYIRLLFKLPLKFRNVLQNTESRSSFAYNQNIKEDIFTKLEVSLCFKTKRNINWFFTENSTQRASNIRERTGYNV